MMLYWMMVIVIVNSRFLRRSQKRSRGNYSLFTGACPKQNRYRQRVRPRESGTHKRQSDGYGKWCLKLIRGEKKMIQDRICWRRVF